MAGKPIPLKEFLKGFETQNPGEARMPSGTYTITTENGVAIVKEFKPLSKKQVQ